MVLGQGLKLAFLGVTIGVASAAALAQVPCSLLYEVSGRDPPTFTGVVLLMIGIATLACYLPAHRATEADLMFAL